MTEFLISLFGATAVALVFSVVVGRAGLSGSTGREATRLALNGLVGCGVWVWLLGDFSIVLVTLLWASTLPAILGAFLLGRRRLTEP